MAVNIQKTSYLDKFGKIPPQDIEVEQAVLGALMLEPDAYCDISGLINENSFYPENHKIIFAAIKELNSQFKPIDLITVTQLLKAKGQLENVGGAIYITQLTGRSVMSAHVKHHAAIIEQLHIKRELINICSSTIQEAYDENSDIDNLMDGIRTNFSRVEDIALLNNTGQSQSEVVQQAIEEIEKDCIESEAGRPPGITTGFKTINKGTGGWRNTNLIIIAARPGVGKTSLALHFAKAAARKGKWVNFYGLEMKSTDLMRIMISGESGVNRTNIRDGLIGENDWNDINAAMNGFDKLPIIWNDYAGLTVQQIKANTIKNRKAGKCDLIILDYLQILKPTDEKVNREQQISAMSRTLKNIALSENIPLICLSQLNRVAESGKPQLHHLRESGAIEQDADVVIFAWKDESKYMLSIAKNRRGILGDVEIFANTEMTGFGDINEYSNPESFNNEKPF